MKNIFIIDFAEQSKEYYIGFTVIFFMSVSKNLTRISAPIFTVIVFSVAIWRIIGILEISFFDFL